MIVWLASYPRSGNTFFRMLLHQHYGIKTFSIYNDPDLTNIGAANAVGHVEMPATIDQLRKDESIHFIKTHELPSDDSLAIYLVRDGRDALVSHSRYLMKFYWQTDSPIRRLKQIIGWENFDRTLRNVIISSRWSDHTLQWTKYRKNNSSIVIKYENLIEDPESVIKQSIEQLNLSLEASKNQQIAQFLDLQQKWPQFFRKGKKGTWKQEMPEKLHKLFWDYHQEAMELFEYSK